MNRSTDGKWLYKGRNFHFQLIFGLNHRLCVNFMSLLLEVLLKYTPGNFTSYRLNFKIGRDMLRAINRDLNGEIVVDHSLFEEIMESCTEKKVVSCCKKLSKKCTLTSGATATTLAELAYWLYVYEHTGEALRVCEFSHIEEPKPNKVNYNIWDYILFMWGLEAYIYRKQGDEEKATERIAAMERVWSTPTGKWKTPEMALSQHKAICNRLSFDDAIYREKIERATAEEDKSSANARRFTALYKMIGYGVTGLFPKLEERKEELEKMINDYIQAQR